ncbi:MAG TPA: glycosyltransferase family protein [Oculatellaceae cyanobacterium]|jgi:spore coat polysaccharide biosynthesis protein SpsF
MKIVAIIQARMGSTRLPGKVMNQLCDKTVLAHVITRVKACSLVDEVVVATTTASADDVIVTEAEKCGAKSFRGSEANVLERYYLAAKEHQAEVVVRVTSDCPLFDPQVLGKMLADFQNKTTQGIKVDYLSNTLSRSYPIGLDAEIFTFNALQLAFVNTQQHYEREHVTPYIYQHPELFALHNYSNSQDLSAYRWTLDTESDFILIEKIYASLYAKGKIFSTNEIVNLFKEMPYLSQVNAHVHQKILGE